MHERKLSGEDLERVRTMNIGRKHTAKAKEKIRLANIGRKHTESTKEKIRMGNIGKIISEEHKDKLRTPRSDETKDRISRSRIGKYGGEKNSFYGKKHTDETKQLMRANHARLSGENSPAWKGGVSFEPYCPHFNEPFRESIREKFGRVCFLCPITEEEQINAMRSRGKRPYKLSVHHVNYNKECLCDDSECEFIPLCLACHGKTNTNRENWESTIMEKLKMIEFKNIVYNGDVTHVDCCQ